MVYDNDASAVWETMGTSLAHRHALPASIYEFNPRGLGKVTPEVIYISQVARALSTTAPYSAKWSAFQCRCMGRGRDCTSCHLPQVLIFLQLLMDRNLTLSMVKTYSAAFPSCYEGDGERFVFVLVKHFLNTNLSL